VEGNAQNDSKKFVTFMGTAARLYLDLRLD
jgi:hypothetical protein